MELSAHKFVCYSIMLILTNTYIMSDLKLKGNWNEVKGKLKQKYGELTDDDLVYVEGKEDELYGRLQNKLGKKKEEIASEIKKLTDQ